jgi:hypothetical protein
MFISLVQREALGVRAELASPGTDLSRGRCEFAETRSTPLVKELLDANQS